jgi:hypothetical protein
MKRGLYLLLSVLVTHSTYSQTTVSYKWDARFGGVNLDQMETTVQSNDGGYILAGYSQSSISGNKTQDNWDTTLSTGDYWIVKIDANGHYLWDKRYGGTGDDALTSICQTKDGGYIIGGISSSGASGDRTQPSWGGYDYWIVKLDSLGNKQWDRRFGGSNDDVLNSIMQTKDGGYMLGGNSNSGISGNKTQADWDPTDATQDYWIVKIDSNGNYQWDKRFGGTSEDDGCKVIQTPDGGYLVGGLSESDASGNKTQANFGTMTLNYWIVKTDSAGNKQWDMVYGGVLGEVFVNALNIPSGGYMLGGTSYDGVSGDKTASICGYWLVKIDTAGNKLGDWAYGNCGTLNSLSHTSDGGYLLTGVSGELLTIKIDSQMNVIWDKSSLFVTGASAYSAGGLESSNGRYLVGATTDAEVGGDKTQLAWDSSYDYWIVEYCDSFPLGIQAPEGTMHLLVYPNPTLGDLYINIQKDDLTSASFTLTNTKGQTIYQSTSDHLAHSYTKILDISGLPGGVYMLEVTVDGERIVKKILKE